MALTHEFDPCLYFQGNHFAESLLKRFLFQPSIAILDVVVSYAADSVSNYFMFLQSGGNPQSYEVRSADFRRLRVIGAMELSMELNERVRRSQLPSGNADQDWCLFEDSLVNPQRRVITTMSCSDKDGVFRCDMSIDSIGCLRWIFEELWVDRIVASVDHKQGKRVYTNTTSGSMIDNINPFQIGDAK